MTRYAVLRFFAVFWICWLLGSLWLPHSALSFQSALAIAIVDFLCWADCIRFSTLFAVLGCATGMLFLGGCSSPPRTVVAEAPKVPDAYLVCDPNPSAKGASTEADLARVVAKAKAASDDCRRKLDLVRQVVGASAQ